MLFGWKSPRHMRYGMGGSALIEAQQFYNDYLRTLYPPSEDEDEEDSNDPPWEVEAIKGEMT